MKNQNAVALGKLAKGKKKTGLTRAERNRRRELAINNLAKIALLRAKNQPVKNN